MESNNEQKFYFDGTYVLSESEVANKFLLFRRDGKEIDYDSLDDEEEIDIPSEECIEESCLNFFYINHFYYCGLSSRFSGSNGIEYELSRDWKSISISVIDNQYALDNIRRIIYEGLNEDEKIFAKVLYDIVNRQKVRN